MYDKSNAQMNTMFSAAPTFCRNSNKYYIFFSNQTNDNNQGVRYSIQLADAEKKALCYYDKDSKNGPHKHECQNGEKLKKHIIFSDKIDEIVADMFNVIDGK